MKGFETFWARNLLVAGASIAAMSLAAQAQASDAPAASQPAANNDSGTEEIIVTAQRREQRLQNVPISISAVGNVELAQRNISDLQQLASAVPGLVITGEATQAAAGLISIRGISGQPSPIGQSQTVAVYIDGQYLSRPDAAFFGLDDVERIEVLRGPQGTLYGRNSTGGAVNIITRDPGTTVRGGADINYGNFNHFSAKGSLSGPLGAGFGAGISASYEKRDGFFTNIVNGDKLGDVERYTVRGKLKYESPDGSFRAVLAGDTGRNTRTVPYRSVYNAAGALINYTDPWQVSVDSIAEGRIKDTTFTQSTGIALTMNYKAADNVEVTSLTNYRYFNSQIVYSVYFGGFGIPVVGRGVNSAKTFSQELRTVATFGALKATIGANYYHENQTFGTASASPPTVFGDANAPATNSVLDAFGIFTQLEYSITDQLTLVGGLRYNNESRDFLLNYGRTYNPTGAAGAPAVATPPPTGVPGPITPGHIGDATFIPSAGVNFQANPDMLFYAKFSRGYQAPGYNAFPGVFTNGSGGLYSPINTFEPEKLDAYEVGAKTQFLDRRVTLNVAGFYYKYSNLQVQHTIGPSQVEIQNAASATVKGIEGSLTVVPVRGLTLSGNLTYLDAKYDRFCEPTSQANPIAGDPICAGTVSDADRSGNQLTNAPKWQGGVAVSYTVPVGTLGEIHANGSYFYQSNSYFASNNEPLQATGSINQFDARLGFQLTGGPEIYAYGKNLTNESHLDTAARATALTIFQHYADPRTYGVGVRYRF